MLWFALLSRQNLVFGRYLLPMLPPLAVIVAVAVGLIYSGIQSLPEGEPATASTISGVMNTSMTAAMTWPSSGSHREDSPTLTNCETWE